jgi:hypothetical protein
MRINLTKLAVVLSRPRKMEDYLNKMVSVVTQDGRLIVVILMFQ